jgi:hypothetical protein
VARAAARQMSFADLELLRQGVPDAQRVRSVEAVAH